MVSRSFTKIILAILIVFCMQSGIAFASQADQIPHGGYDSLSNSCLYCHDIHESEGDYVLMRQETVVETCGTCHDIYLNSLNWIDDRWENEAGYPGEIPDFGTASELSAYKVDYEEKDDVGGHKLSQGEGEFEFADGEIESGDYIPGGSNRLTAISGPLGLDDDDEDGLINSLDRTATAGLYCASCHTPHGVFGEVLRTSVDEDGDGVNDLTVNSDGRSKLLSSYPNHSEDSVTVDDWYEAGGINWCGVCHDKWVSFSSGNGDDEPHTKVRAKGRVQSKEGDEVVHNHPSEYCLNCHGNYDGPVDEDGYPSSEEAQEDFPHTSPAGIQNLLTDVPDALCLQCHSAGSLP